MVDWIEVGQRVRQIRKEKGLNQREFGRQFGVSQNMISLYEKGKSRATVEFYVRVARFGGKTIEWLLDGREDRAGETFREMRDLHEKMKGHLAVVRQMLDREAEAAVRQRFLSVTDPAELRDLLRQERDLPSGLKAAVEDAGLWLQLALTAREVSAFLTLAQSFGDMNLERLTAFLRLVRSESGALAPEQVSRFLRPMPESRGEPHRGPSEAR